jgi:PAS domain S-box-containing protein
MEDSKALEPLRARAMEFAHTGIIITDAIDPENPVIDCNPAFEVITGYSRAEVLGRNLRFLHRDQPDIETLSAIRTAIRRKRHVTVIIRNFRKDGSMFWNELSISPVYDELGHLTHFIGIQNNVTVRETARLDLNSQNQELTQINQELQVKSRQQKDIDKRINELLKQSHSEHTV